MLSLVECAAIDYERRLLMGCRQDMDFSRHEYTNNPNEAKRLTFERAQQRFNAQMAKVLLSISIMSIDSTISGI